MSKSPSNAFNQASDKVVAYGEWRKKTFALYKEHLSLGEKFFLYGANIPASAVQGIVLGLKDVVTGAKLPGSFVDTTSFPPKFYASGACLDAAIERAGKMTFSKAFDAKLNSLAGQAFEQCEDISKTPKMLALKPL